MTGRNRRASTSSVDTIDDEDIQWRQEASVLRGVGKDVPSDNWPIFQLRDAIVLNRDGTTIESALNIVTNGPFIVRGDLYLTKDEKHLAIIRGRCPIPIEIRHCLLYSVGETEDGSPQIWVSGRAGWFELSPCPAYQSTYDSMCQATTLYYSMMDIIEDTKSKRGKKTKSQSQNDILAAMFHKYAAFVGDGSTYDDVVERCNKHAVFLISQFLQDDGAVEWHSTDFYKWMISRNGALFEKVEKAKKNPRQRTRSPSYVEPPLRLSSSVSRKSASIEEIDESAFKTRSNRSNSATTQQTTIAMHPRRSAKAPEHPTPTHVATDADTPFQTVLAAVESAFDSIAPSKNGVTVSGLLNKLFFQYRFPTFNGAHRRPVEEVLHYNAGELLKAIDRKKYKNGEVYDWLERLSKEPFAPIALVKPGALPYRVVPRERRPFQSRKPETKLEAPEHNVRTPSPVTPRVGKRPGRPVGSKSSLRPIKSTKKRNRPIFDDDQDDSESVAKKLNFLSEHDADETMTDIDNQNSQDEAVFEDALQVNESSDSSSEDEAEDDEDRPVKLSILAEKLPDPMPTGYQGTWVCDQQDCDFIARGGEEDELDDLISAHLQEHEQLVDRMQLAVNESRGLLPINHLLEKLKQIGEGAHQPTDSQGNVAPRPIKRNLFV
ncbi:hypothetical protein PWT90_07829 [Aphanocladium album]|nr:hypothetical protein PWT90_07829 [Aphanocladium album]